MTERRDTNRLPNPHPGDILREEFLEPLGITAYRLAKEIGATPASIHELIKGQRTVTPRTALRLAAFFGTTPQFWLNLQMLYDLEEERRGSPDEFARIQGIKPLERPDLVPA
jgi:addiction module HigA family antidote